MIGTLVWGLPVAAAVTGASAWILRRSPEKGFSRLLALNGVLLLGGLGLLAAVLLGATDAAAATGTASSSSTGALIGAGIAVAGSSIGAGIGARLGEQRLPQRPQVHGSTAQTRPGRWSSRSASSS